MRSFQQVMKGEEYSVWQQMVLASLVKEQQDTFDIEDKRQVAESAAFLASLMKRFKEVEQADSGPVLLMHFLVQLLQRDFEVKTNQMNIYEVLFMTLQVWWKEQRKKENRPKPLVHFLFGGDGRSVSQCSFLPRSHWFYLAGSSPALTPLLDHCTVLFSTTRGTTKKM